MSSSRGDPEDVAAQIMAGSPVSVELDLKGFRRVNHLVRQAGVQHGIQWLVVLLGDHAYVQVRGRPSVGLELREEELRYYSNADFTFLDQSAALLFGSVYGRLSLRGFVEQTLGWRWAAGHALAFVLLSAGGASLPGAFMAKVTDALIAALAIFVSIFVLFVLNIDPEAEFRYLINGRYSILAQSDRYIAVVGLAALCASILGAGAIAVAPPHPGLALRIGEAVAFAASVVLTAASFALVVNYHFRRRQQMIEIRMADVLLRKIQDEARQQ